MVAKIKSAILVINGKKYIAEYDRLCNQGAFESTAYRWCICEENADYVGDFSSLKQAVKFIKGIKSC